MKNKHLPYFDRYTRNRSLTFKACRRRLIKLTNKKRVHIYGKPTIDKVAKILLDYYSKQ